MNHEELVQRTQRLETELLTDNNMNDFESQLRTFFGSRGDVTEKYARIGRNFLTSIRFTMDNIPEWEIPPARLVFEDINLSVPLRLITICFKDGLYEYVHSNSGNKGTHFAFDSNSGLYVRETKSYGDEQHPQERFFLKK